MRKLAAATVMVVGLAFGGGAVAGAQTTCPESPQTCTPPPSVGGNPVTPGTPATPRPTPEVGAGPVEPGLPVTGTDTAVLVGAGAVLVAGGGALVLRSRRTADAA